jgi:hypothetical protein
MGLTAGRGRWIQRTLDITAASTFTKFDAVGVAAARTVSLYSGGDDNFLGIATHDSSASLPAGKVVVTIPADASCTVIADVPTGVAQSSCSFGQTVGLYAVGGSTSYVTFSYTSDAGRPFTVVGPINSVNSTIELVYKPNTGVYGSAFSATLV